MSQHPSLKESSVGNKHRNVLKRYERVNRLKKEERWSEKSTVYKLPKVKSIKLKVKKAAKAAAGAEGAAGAAAPAAGAAKAAAKPADKKK